MTVRALEDTDLVWVDTEDKLRDMISIVRKDTLDYPYLGVDLEYYNANKEQDGWMIISLL